MNHWQLFHAHQPTLAHTSQKNPILVLVIGYITHVRVGQADQDLCLFSSGGLSWQALIYMTMLTELKFLRILAPVEFHAHLYKSYLQYPQILMSWLDYFAIARYGNLDISCTTCTCYILSFTVPKAKDLQLKSKIWFCLKHSWEKGSSELCSCLYK